MACGSYRSGDSTYISKDMSTSTVYNVTSIPCKGLGLVARVKISAGQPILYEQPLVSVQLSETGDLHGQMDKSTGEFRSLQLDTELRKLTDNELKKFYGLTDVFSKGKNKKTNFGIIKTNSFSVNKCDRTHLVLFPDIARINHSCAPNCHHYWSGQLGKFVVRAVEDIPEGAEICISYMSPLQRADFHDKVSRREILLEEFGFNCLCSLCCQENAEENDRKRRRILEIENNWSDLGNNPEAALELGEKQFELCCELNFQAGLLSYVALHCVEASSLLVAKKKSCIEVETSREKAVKYAKKSRYYGKIAYGPDSEEYHIFKVVVTICETANNQELLLDIQHAISSLRDIDAKI